MDLLEFCVVLVIALVVLLIAYMVTRVVQESYRAKAAKSRQMSAVRRGNTSPSPQTREPAPWVDELLEGLGHSTEELYEDEMPDDLVQLLNSPMVKGFLGGLQKPGGEGGPPGGQEGFY